MFSIARLAMLAASGAGVAQAARRATMRLAGMIALAVVVAVLGAAALCAAGIAAFYALAEIMDPAWAALVVAGCFLVLAALTWLIGRAMIDGGRSTTTVGAEAADMVAGPMADIAGGVGGFLERHGVAVLMAAFVAGMLMNRRR